jgi:hypothetical protein
MRRLTEATDEALHGRTGYGLTFWMASICAGIWLTVVLWFGAALVLFGGASP